MKLPGVVDVEVSLKQASAEIFLKADNTLTMPQIRETLKKNGYPTRDAQVTARGRIVLREGKPALDLLNGGVLELAPGQKPVAGQDIVELSGTSRAKGKTGEVLTIKPGGDDQADVPGAQHGSPPSSIAGRQQPVFLWRRSASLWTASTCTSA
jgi:hypothetical protein